MMFVELFMKLQTDRDPVFSTPSIHHETEQPSYYLYREFDLYERPYLNYAIRSFIIRHEI